MKKATLSLVMLLIGVIAFQSCNNGKTYAEYKKEEREAIRKFIELNHIKVIEQDEFLAKDTTTDLSQNEYVLFADNGVYMQIIDRGRGEVMSYGRHELLARYWECKITSTGSLDTISTNALGTEFPYPDELVVTRDSTSFSGSFSLGEMSSRYGASVPGGWLLPFKYLKTGRTTSARSKIRLIVPHSEGTSTATSYIYPTLYEITFQLSR
ncbi:MAG: DUF4827 domain-containing protein [Bacteroidales bacterium]|nr:DUF4827 domain-containing protein [Bacteroidales bacterium]